MDSEASTCASSNNPLSSLLGAYEEDSDHEQDRATAPEKSDDLLIDDFLNELEQIVGETSPTDSSANLQTLPEPSQSSPPPETEIHKPQENAKEDLGTTVVHEDQLARDLAEIESFAAQISVPEQDSSKTHAPTSKSSDSENLSKNPSPEEENTTPMVDKTTNEKSPSVASENKTHENRNLEISEDEDEEDGLVSEKVLARRAALSTGASSDAKQRYVEMMKRRRKEKETANQESAEDSSSRAAAHHPSSLSWRQRTTTSTAAPSPTDIPTDGSGVGVTTTTTTNASPTVAVVDLTLENDEEVEAPKDSCLSSDSNQRPSESTSFALPTLQELEESKKKLLSDPCDFSLYESVMAKPSVLAAFVLAIRGHDARQGDLKPTLFSSFLNSIQTPELMHRQLFEIFCPSASGGESGMVNEKVEGSILVEETAAKPFLSLTPESAGDEDMEEGEIENDQPPPPPPPPPLSTAISTPFLVGRTLPPPPPTETTYETHLPPPPPGPFELHSLLTYIVPPPPSTSTSTTTTTPEQECYKICMALLGNFPSNFRSLGSGYGAFTFADPFSALTALSILSPSHPLVVRVNASQNPSTAFQQFVTNNNSAATNTIGVDSNPKDRFWSHVPQLISPTAAMAVGNAVTVIPHHSYVRLATLADSITSYPLVFTNQGTTPATASAQQQPPPPPPPLPTANLSVTNPAATTLESTAPTPPSVYFSAPVVYNSSQGGVSESTTSPHSTVEIVATSASNALQPTNSASGAVAVGGNQPPAGAGAAVTGTTKKRKEKGVVSLSKTQQKKMSKMVQKWVSVKGSDSDTSSDSENFDFEQMERKKKQKLEEWRTQQIRSGMAEENPNFVPVAGDWRDQLSSVKTEVLQAASVPKEKKKTTKKATSSH